MAQPDESDRQVLQALERAQLKDFLALASRALKQ